MSDGTAFARQYPPMTMIVRQYIQWCQVSLKIDLVDRVDWRLAKRILHGDLSLLLCEFLHGTQNSCHEVNSSIHCDTVFWCCLSVVKKFIQQFLVKIEGHLWDKNTKGKNCTPPPPPPLFGITEKCTFGNYTSLSL